MASASVKSLAVCFAVRFPIPLLLKVGPSANLRRPSESFRSLALPQEIVPTVSGSKPAVEEVVTLLAGNLEADVTETLSRDDGLLTFAANDGCPEFHRSPPQAWLALPCRTIRFGAFPDPCRPSVNALVLGQWP